jgi:S-adenosylmethionine:tRNA ribosyltransferase-isomerase
MKPSMRAAQLPAHRPADAKLMMVDARGAPRHTLRAAFAEWLRPNDLVVANDAATLPACLRGTHARTGARIEIRLAGRRSLDVDAVSSFDAIVFGEGDFRTRTELRPAPPALLPGDRLLLGPLRATIERALDHPRLVTLTFDGTPAEIWAGLARHGRPIQYAHVPAPLALWDVWSSHAALPAAFETPSAGFLLSWQVQAEIRARGAQFATLTHAAGISSTGDPALDARLPFDEPYFIPPGTAEGIRIAKSCGGRIVAIGTTVVRALEHAAGEDGIVASGFGIANQRIGADTVLRVVDAIVSGTHEPGSSHHELLRAFATDASLARAQDELERRHYTTHEFGDSVLIERARGKSGILARGCAPVVANRTTRAAAPFSARAARLRSSRRLAARRFFPSRARQDSDG